MTQLSNAALEVISKYVGGKTADQVAFIVEDLAESIEVWTKAYGLSDWRIFTYSPENVPVLEYLPYAFFCYLSLLLTILFGFTGITISCKDGSSIRKQPKVQMAN